jgi:hypothetical protein
MKLTARELQTLEIALQLFLSEWQYDEGEGYEPITEQDITALISRLDETDPTA